MKSRLFARTACQPLSPCQLTARLNSCIREVRSAACRLALAFLWVAVTASAASTQTVPSFEVSNPTHQKWSPAQAQRIYTWACELLARTVRPENPPRLSPHFRLVLGADENTFVRNGPVDEIRLQRWDPNRFAEGVVVVAVRDLVHSDQQLQVARRSVMLADSTLDVRDRTSRH